jgi:hypothetical protein
LSTTKDTTTKDTLTKERTMPEKSGSSYSKDFLLFWSSYPKRSGSKSQSWKNWKKLNGQNPGIEIILAAIKAQTEWRANARDGDLLIRTSFLLGEV